MSSALAAKRAEQIQLASGFDPSDVRDGDANADCEAALAEQYPLRPLHARNRWLGIAALALIAVAVLLLLAMVIGLAVALHQARLSPKHTTLLAQTSVNLATPDTVSSIAFGSCTAYDFTKQTIWEEVSGVLLAA